MITSRAMPSRSSIISRRSLCAESLATYLDASRSTLPTTLATLALDDPGLACATSPPKIRVGFAKRGTGVGACVGETRQFTPPSLALTFCMTFAKYCWFIFFGLWRMHCVGTPRSSSAVSFTALYISTFTPVPEGRRQYTSWNFRRARAHTRRKHSFVLSLSPRLSTSKPFSETRRPMTHSMLLASEPASCRASRSGTYGSITTSAQSFSASIPPGASRSR